MSSIFRAFQSIDNMRVESAGQVYLMLDDIPSWYTSDPRALYLTTYDAALPNSTSSQISNSNSELAQNSLNQGVSPTSPLTSSARRVLSATSKYVNMAQEIPTASDPTSFETSLEYPQSVVQMSSFVSHAIVESISQSNPTIRGLLYNANSTPYMMDTTNAPSREFTNRKGYIPREFLYKSISINRVFSAYQIIAKQLLISAKLVPITYDTFEVRSPYPEESYQIIFTNNDTVRDTLEYCITSTLCLYAYR